MTQSIDAATARRPAPESDPRRSDSDLFADDPFERPLTPPEDRADDWDAPDRPLASEKRAAKRRVIVDDAYGWDRGDPDEEPERDPDLDAAESDLAAPARRLDSGSRLADAPSRRARTSDQLPAPLIDPLEPAEARGAGWVWWWAIVASLIWTCGVLAFAIGSYGLPLWPAEDLLRAALSLPQQLQLMIGAVAIAPLGLIWMNAVNARRARALAAEAQRLTRLASRLSATAAPAAAATPALPGIEVDPHALRMEVEGAAAALDALDQKFAAAEDRAQISRERLQGEREQLARLVREIEAEATRAEQEADRFRQATGLLADGASRAGAAGSEMSPERAEALAGMIAKALAAQGFEGAAARMDGGAAETLAAAPDAGRRRAEPAIAERAPRRADPAAEAGPNFDAPAFDALDDGFEEGFEPEPRGGRREPEPEAARRATASRGGDEASYAPSPASPPAPQPSRAPTLDWEKFVRAANFPDSEDDRETLEALYAVLTDREAAALLQTAEDVLSTLADLNLFMEDMPVHHAPAELWRSFILDGTTRDVLDIGGIRDAHAIQDVEFALNDRPEFLTISKTFFDQYEQLLTRLFEETDDPTLAVELADTRTGRAYMLIGRAEGRFGD